MRDNNRTFADDDLEQVIAKVESTWLGYEDHGIFSLNVGFTYGSSSQGTGHFCVCSSGSDSTNDIHGIRLIKAIVDACGVERWEKLVGRTVFVLKEPGWNGMVRGIAPLPTEKGERVGNWPFDVEATGPAEMPPIREVPSGHDRQETDGRHGEPSPRRSDAGSPRRDKNGIADASAGDGRAGEDRQEEALGRGAKTVTR